MRSGGTEGSTERRGRGLHAPGAVSGGRGEGRRGEGRRGEGGEGVVEQGRRGAEGKGRRGDQAGIRVEKKENK